MDKVIILSHKALQVSGGNGCFIEHFLRYRRKRGEAMLEMFFDRVPRTGDSLWRLFEESEMSFFEFADRVIAGKYIPHQIGWVIGNCMAWPLLLISIIGKEFLPSREDSDVDPESDIVRTKGITQVFVQGVDGGEDIFIGCFTSRTYSYASSTTVQTYRDLNHY